MHQKLLAARKGMGAHDAYDGFRAASETLALVERMQAPAIVLPKKKDDKKSKAWIAAPVIIILGAVGYMKYAGKGCFAPKTDGNVAGAALLKLMSITMVPKWLWKYAVQCIRLVWGRRARRMAILS
jgi:hypothetical protein